MFFLQRRDVAWEKVPFVARPSLIADPITAFGKRHTGFEERKRESSILERINREAIKPKPESYLRPLEGYKSPRDETREKVMKELNRYQTIRDAGGIASITTDPQSMDLLLPKLHGKSDRNIREPHRRPYFVSNYY